MLMAEPPPPQIKLARLGGERFKCDFFRQEANVRVYCTAHNLAENRKSELCAASERRVVESAAVEPSWALINNLLIYHSLSLKRRLQATEGCRRRRWRWADKTHSGGLLSAWWWRQFLREREWNRGGKIQTLSFFLYINLFTGRTNYR